MAEQPLASPTEQQPEQQPDAEQVMAHSGHTFHLAARLLPMQMRTHATELYAFCRRMDDLADEAAREDGSGNHDQLAHAIQVLNQHPLSDEAAALG